jgi:glutathione peroxidase-family protein
MYMKKIFGFALLLFFLFAFTAQTSVFDLSITMCDGSNLALGSFQGRRLVVVILPSTTTQADSATLQLLQTLNNDYKDSVTFVGVPSYEDGFTDEDAPDLLDFYRSYLDESFLITAGMYTHKTSDQQSSLFSYLTHAQQNGYFDNDVLGAGEKFFTDANGDLTGLSAPDAVFSEDIFKDMINK